MTKQKFLDKLRAKLKGLPKKEVEETLSIYSEMIDDRIEDGKSEEEAVADTGSVKEAISQILSEIPMSKLIKEKVRPKRKLSALEIVLLVLGSPIWISIIAALFAVVVAVYASIWSIVVSLWAVFAAFVGSSFGGIVSGIIFICTGSLFSGLAIIAASLVLAGLSIFMFFGCVASTKGMAILTKKIALFVKKCFVKKEVA